jgi:eukaryotic-like serine/threonine-protein kinase
MQARIGKYEVDAEIGNGTLVKVFRALDRDTGRPVTLKLLAEAGDRRVADLFRRKVATAAKLSHKNLIAIYELGEHEGLPFAAMQHLDEGSLRAAIRTRTSVPLLRKMTILYQVADGLLAAHHGGLGSVGLRPSGIALGADGMAILHDFSIVRLIGEAEDDAPYASPEELNAGLTPDPLCDIFAFGAICSEFLTGADPLPDALDRLVQRALEPNRDLRYQSIGQVLEDAEPILCGMKRARAATLLADARRRQGGEALENVQAVVREVLELDPGNRQAGRLHASIRAELQRRALKSRIESWLAEAEQEAAGRHFARAVELLDSARRLDPADPEVSRRLEQMCTRLERSQNAAQLVADARQLLVEQDLDGARTKAGEAHQQDPDLPEIAELLQAIAAARLLAEANSLLADQAFDDAIAIVQELRAQCHDSMLLELWLERAQAQRAEAQRQTRLQSELARIRTLMAQEHLQEALNELAVLREEFPGEAAASALEEQAGEAIRRADLLRQVLAEAQWLLDQEHPDLAVQFLREKCRRELPDEPRLAARLAEVEQMLPDWENRRFVQDCLGRAAALEKLEQWAVALALVEQALETCPAAEELRQTAARFRDRQREQDQRKKLARRLETIWQKLTAEAWPQALRLIEAAREEFPDEPQLQLLRAEAGAGLRRSECEAVAIAVRQCLADGETERAEQILNNGLESVEGEPLLEELLHELEAARQQREAWRQAQALFGRRQYREAEEILTALAAQGRADANALLETARASRASSEEQDFFKRGHEQALKFIEQGQFEQAADLVRNLLNLFPQDPILQRDLRLAQAGEPKRDREEAVVPEASKTPPIPAPKLPVPTLELTVGSQGPSRVLWATLAGSILLVSASAAVWKVSHTTTVQPPYAISTPAAVLPKLAVQRGIHGGVKVEATVSEQGNVTEVRVLSGDPILAAAAQDAVLKWRFQPAVRNGRAVQMNVQVLVLFESLK